ncbi:hypothetical protein ACJX0J_018981 [Zea mays]
MYTDVNGNGSSHSHVKTLKTKTGIFLYQVFELEDGDMVFIILIDKSHMQTIVRDRLLHNILLLLLLIFVLRMLKRIIYLSRRIIDASHNYHIVNNIFINKNYMDKLKHVELHIPNAQTPATSQELNTLEAMATKILAFLELFD